MHNFILNLLLGYPKIIGSYAVRYSYFSISIFTHGLVLVLLCYFGIYKPAQENHSQRVNSYLQNRAHVADEYQIKSSLKNLAEMESLLAKSIGETELKDDKELAEKVKKVLERQELKSQEPKARLEHAKKMAEDIKDIEQSLRAKDLEKAMSISHQEAIKKVVQADFTETKSPPETNMARVLELMEKKASEALLRRQKQLDREQVGIPISFFDEQNFQFNKKGNGTDGANGSDSGNLYAELSGLQKMRSYVSDKLHHSEFKRNNFVDLWISRIPAVGKKNPEKQMGRVIGENGAFADRIYINSWYVIGPFYDRNKKHPPEYEIDLDAKYLGKSQKFIKWQYVHDGHYPLVPPQADKNGIFYGYTEITLDQEQELWVWIGADDFVSLWLNENALWESDSFNWKFNTLAYAVDKKEWNNWNLTEYKRRVYLKKGVNRFFFKLTNLKDNCFFSLVLTK